MGSPQAVAGCSRWSRSSRGSVEYVLAASARDSLPGPEDSGSGPASGSPQQDADAASPEAAAELVPEEVRLCGGGSLPGTVLFSSTSRLLEPCRVCR